MGRALGEANLWLALFPMEEATNQQLMDEISGLHATLRCGEQAEIRDHSRAGTEVNGTPLAADWRVLEDGDVIGFRRRALELRARVTQGQWLRLERIDNGAEVENYLLLRGNATLGGRSLVLPLAGDLGPLVKLHRGQGGFVIECLAERMLVNDRLVERGEIVGLREGDLVNPGAVVFRFRVGAYPKK